MSRNRMKNSQSLHWMGVVKWILIVGLMSVLGLSYMLCKNQNLHVAEETHRLQLQLNAIENRNAALAFDLEKMKSQRELERRLVQMHSTLVRLDDMRLTVVPMEQNTRMRLARIGTEPNHAINLDTPVATADATPAQH
jgi:hypothetical protein